MILGTPKSLEEFQTFSAVELQELFRGMEELATSGTPLGVPGSLAIGQLARIAITLRRYYAISVDLAAMATIMEAREEPDPIHDRAMFLGVAKRAADLIRIEPPKEQRIIVPPSRILKPS